MTTLFNKKHEKFKPIEYDQKFLEIQKERAIDSRAFRLVLQIKEIDKETKTGLCCPSMSECISELKELANLNSPHALQMLVVLSTDYIEDIAQEEVCDYNAKLEKIVQDEKIARQKILLGNLDPEPEDEIKQDCEKQIVDVTPEAAFEQAVAELLEEEQKQLKK